MVGNTVYKIYRILCELHFAHQKLWDDFVANQTLFEWLKGMALGQSFMYVEICEV